MRWVENTIYDDAATNCRRQDAVKEAGQCRFVFGRMVDKNDLEGRCEVVIEDSDDVPPFPWHLPFHPGRTIFNYGLHQNEDAQPICGDKPETLS